MVSTTRLFLFNAVYIYITKGFSKYTLTPYFIIMKSFCDKVIYIQYTNKEGFHQSHCFYYLTKI